jgi:GTP-binding protein Era
MPETPPKDRTAPEEATRCGFVALIGAPNSGKSTLTNALVGAKVSIVTHKAQTTRGPARGLDEKLGPIVEHLPEIKRPTIAILNKIDLVKKPDLLRLTGDLSALKAFDQVFMISALTGDGIADLKAYLAEAVPLGPWLFPEDQLSDASLRQTAAEITREKLFLRLHEELPYALTVETTEWKELKDGSVRIEQTIYVERESQRRIVLGAKGSMIKEIGQAARAEIAEIAGVPVHLFLFVKVRERWGEDPERFREMGLDYPRKD